MISTTTVTIADGESLSGATAHLGTKVPVGVSVTTGWTTAAITFQGSVDGLAYVDLYNSAGELATPSLAAGSGCSLKPEDFRAWRFLKVRSGTSGSAVNQAAGDVVTLVLMEQRLL